MEPLSIGIDLLGSDTSKKTLLEGAIQALERCSRPLFFHLYSNQQVAQLPETHFQWHHTPQTVEMDDHPLFTARTKKRSSLFLSLQDLKRGEIQGLLSCGNTGALIVLAKCLLTPKSPLNRPILLTAVPTLEGHCFLMDAGSQPSLDPQSLFHATELAVCHIRQKTSTVPSIGLLNIGVEKFKGAKEHQELHEKLETFPSFMGNIEPQDVFHAKVDLVVTDGFTGNIFLKTSEAVSDFLLEELRSQLSPPHVELLQKHFMRFHHRFSQDSYPAAFVLGIEESLVKCHGNTSATAIRNAILEMVGSISSPYSAHSN